MLLHSHKLLLVPTLILTVARVPDSSISGMPVTRVTQSIRNGCETLETYLLFTDRVRSTRKGYVLTRVCPSVCLSTPRGGTLARSRSRGGGNPDQVQAGGYPTSGTPPVRPGWGGTPAGLVPHLGYPYQTWLGVPHLR